MAFAPGPQQAGHVVGLVAQPAVVARPPRREGVVADPPAVDLGDVDPVGGGVQPGRGDRAVDGELAAQQGGGAALGGGRARSARPASRRRQGPARRPRGRSSPTRDPSAPVTRTRTGRASRGRSGAAGHGHEHRRGGRHPEDLVADRQLVGGLPPAAARPPPATTAAARARRCRAPPGGARTGRATAHPRRCSFTSAA